MLKRFDIFASTVSFNYGNGTQSFATNAGGFLSICANLLGLLFLVQSLIILQQYRGTQFTYTQEIDYYDEDFSMSAEDGL